METLFPPDDEPASMPSMPTLRGGSPDSLGRIDHYDLLCKLGGGGFGVVYLARDTVSGVEVAIKTLHPLLKHNAEEMVLLREKFALVSRLAHPNIATALVLHPVRDINVFDEAARRELKLSPGDSVMVMRYAPGVTLSKWRRQFPGGIAPFDLAFEVGRQVAAALDYAHAERIVHRDIKPGNIMVETVAAEPQPLDHGIGKARSLSAPTLRVRILDFGLAAEIRSSMSRVSTESGDTSGTRPYMAPEQWLGKKQDGRTDQYALACVLYELLSGAPPFAGVFETGDPMIMKSAVVGDEPDEIEYVSPATNEALLRALAKEPKSRFPSCSAFVDQCRSDSGSQPSVVPMEQTESGRAGSRSGTMDSSAVEADVLRRKVALARLLSTLSADDRADAGFMSAISEAETEAAAVDEAIKLDKFFAAAQCLARAEAALERLRNSKAERKRQAETERAAREREKAEQEEKARLEAKRREATGPKPGDVKVVEIVPGVDMEFCWCPATTSNAWKSISGGDDFFWMGSPKDEFGRQKDEKPHQVTLTKGFWLGRTPLTQGPWEIVMGWNPSYFQKTNWFGLNPRTISENPVESVSWNDCQDFLKNLNEEMPVSGFKWTLPTEAQWEYACRAGTTGAFGGVNMGWYFDNSGDHTQPVAQKEPNSWGLFDMHGNVGEWCSDWYEAYPSEAITNPTGPSSGSHRVFRGGSWCNNADFCRSACRGRFLPGNRSSSLGFRVALVSVQ